MITETKLIEFFKKNNCDLKDELIFKTKENYGKINVEYRVYYSRTINKIIIQKREERLNTKEVLK